MVPKAGVEAIYAKASMPRPGNEFNKFNFSNFKVTLARPKGRGFFEV
jgi:hypothetical protein